MKKWIRWIFGVLGIVFLGIQLVPVDRSNPPVESEVPASPEVRDVLRRACYDCHSNETRWPWYSYVAPASWLVANDVHEGRRKMNYSAWNQLGESKQQKRFHESWEEVQEGEMPLWFYLPLHPSAKLSDADKTLLKQWSEQSSGATHRGFLERRDDKDHDDDDDDDRG